MAQRVPIAERGPGQSYRPDRSPPSVFGVHQPGIATPLLDHLAFAAFDAEVAGRAELSELLAACSVAAERVMHDRDDVTVTLGLGPALFGPRLRLAQSRPRALAELPLFPGDALAAGVVRRRSLRPGVRARPEDSARRRCTRWVRRPAAR